MGGLDKIIGLNPIGIGIPAGEEEAEVLDIAFGATAHRRDQTVRLLRVDHYSAAVNTQVQTTARYAHLANESVKASGSRVGDSIASHLNPVEP